MTRSHESQRRRTVDTSVVVVEMDAEIAHLETAVAFHAMEVENVAGFAGNEELTVGVIAEKNEVEGTV